jgi:hypothetical protein
MSAPRKDRSPAGFDGPWSSLPPPEPPAREPFLKRRKTAREPWIRNWKGLAIIAFLLFIAPPMASWLSRIILSMMQGG